MIAVPVLVMSVLKNVPIEAFLDGNLQLGEDFTPANITGIAVVAIMALIIFFFLKVAEFFLIIYAAVKAANGELYRYPLTITFVKPSAAPASTDTASSDTTPVLNNQ
jgi:hypothetical protein